MNFRRRHHEPMLEEIHGMVTAHHDRVVTGPSRKVTVARSQVWSSAKLFFQARRRIISHGPLMVQFVGDMSRDSQEEGVVDQGGPRREFFRLLLPDIIYKSGMLQGNAIFFSNFIVI